MTVAPLQLPVWKDVPQLNFAPLDQIGNAFMMRNIMNGLNSAPDPMQGGAQPQQQQGTSLPAMGQPPAAPVAGNALTQDQMALLKQSAQKYGIDPNYLITVASKEGTGQNPKSSADGIGQFTAETAKQYGVVPGNDVSAADGFARFTLDNQATLAKTLGRTPTPDELALAHQQGAGGATALLSNPNANVVDALTPAYKGDRAQAIAAVVNNGGDPNMTAGQFAQKQMAFYSGGAIPPNAQPVQYAGQPQQAQPAQPNGAATIAQPWMTQDAAQRYEQAGTSMYNRAASAAMLNPALSAAMRAKGDAYMKQAEIIRQSLAKNSETTPEMKNAVDPNVIGFEQRKAAISAAAKNAEITPEMKNAAAAGAVGPGGTGNPLAFEAQKKIQEQNITAGQKRYEGIQAQSSQYERDLKPYLDVSRSIINDPRFYSGIGGEFSLDLNRVKAALGDKNAAMLQEALQKVTASSVLGQINNQRAQLEEAGGNSSRIFSQQVDLVEKAAPALANTPAGNRFLVEVASRMGGLSSHVAEMARQYKQDHGTLDTGFDQELSNYMKNNPIFTKQEMSNPAVLGAPTVPPTFANDQLSFMKWTRAMGIKSGEPIRLPDGRVKAAP